MINKMIELAEKLEDNSPRFPYTYHHDILRMKVYGFKMSRSDVANETRHQSEEALYSIALLGLIEQNDIAQIILSLSYDDLATLQEAIRIAQNSIHQIKEEYKNKLLSKIPS